MSVKAASDELIIEARNVRVEEWPCDCPTFEDDGSHLSLCPVILIPALLARIESDRLASLKARAGAVDPRGLGSEIRSLIERLKAEVERLTDELSVVPDCYVCKGTRYYKGSDCPRCHGTGRAR